MSRSATMSRAVANLAARADGRRATSAGSIDEHETEPVAELCHIRLTRERRGDAVQAAKTRPCPRRVECARPVQRLEANAYPFIEPVALLEVRGRQGNEVERLGAGAARSTPAPRRS